jgi:hypothetical protein
MTVVEFFRYLFSYEPSMELAVEFAEVYQRRARLEQARSAS